MSANVVVQVLNIGATTNIEGYFTILNVPPGTYRVQASLLGYKNSAVTNVRVDIDQTTELRIRLSEEAVQQEEVTVVAERPVVERDVSASRANITSVEVAKLPTASIVGVVGLQAGVQTNARGDLIIRGSGGGTTAGGGGSDQVVFLLNGQALRNGRDNSPYTGISLTSLENIQV
ncbi:MAG: carboxypeptidase-like regulatory domain-containing protein, partial [Bacteroidota bacterium]